MHFKHIQATIMPLALKTIKSGKDAEFIKSVIDRLAEFHDKFESGNPPNNKDLKKLERDFIVYSRMLPFKLVASYPEHNVRKITSIIDSYRDFTALFVDSYKYYLTGDILELSDDLRNKLRK